MKKKLSVEYGEGGEDNTIDVEMDITPEPLKGKGFDVFNRDEIKSAVEFLKYKMEKEVRFLDELAKLGCLNLVDEAFEDVTKE